MLVTHSQTYYVGSVGYIVKLSIFVAATQVVSIML